MTNHRTSPALIRVIGGGLTAVLMVGVWYVTLAPSRFGGPLTPVIVRGVSMEPTYSTGDLVLAYRGTPRVGDVLAYEHGGGAVVIHRLVEIAEDGYITQGDNVAAPDPWVVAPEDVLGRTRVVLPGFAHRLSWLTTPGVSGALAGAVAFVVVMVPPPVARRLRRGRNRTPIGVSPRLATVASLATIATLLPVTGAAASMLIQVTTLAPFEIEAPDCTYRVDGNQSRTCQGGPPGGGNGGGPPGQA